jgi:protein phosphatase
MQVTLPELSLVLLVGPSGAGKSTFAKRFFKPTEIISSDACRGLVSDDENDQDATKDAFELLRFIAAKRLAAGKLTVIDATNVQPDSRKPLVALAREFHCLPVAIVLDVPEKVCLERNRSRPDRQFGSHVVRQQLQQMHRSMRGLEREGFRHIHIITPEKLETLEIERQPLWNNLKHETGPFDIIGDIHGCFDELVELLDELGYTAISQVDGVPTSFSHPHHRKVVFLGDLVDRGPKIPQVLRLVMTMVSRGLALCVPGNHEMKLMRQLRGKEVKLTHGMQQSIEQLEKEPPEFRNTVASFIDDLVSHYVLDGGKLVVAHAGLKESMHGRGSGAVRSFALFGETTGETDEYGLPVRHNWAAEYRGKATVVYGHTPVPEAEWLNNTICVDTGCVFGGKLSALRYPEREVVQVQALQVYCEPAKPLHAPVEQALPAQHQLDDLLDLEDTVGRRIVRTRIHHNVTIREENAAAALEAMSRFAANPKWLIYLPPTMSPTETTARPGLLEHPEEAFAYYRKGGVAEVICEEKHMGSRAVVVICRDEAVAAKRFGIAEKETGIVYTRTGRRFFSDERLESALLTRLRASLDSIKLWDELNTDWLCLDCELMPWSVKAQDLIRDQYAAVGAAATLATRATTSVLQEALRRGLEVQALVDSVSVRQQDVERYVQSYQPYCWPVATADDLRLAPFHVLASEGAVHTDKPHSWHMAFGQNVAAAGDAMFVSTPSKTVRLDDVDACEEAFAWWTTLTSAGGEGMVVKPIDFIARNKRGLLQPAVKCRGPEYLRIIYGPEYLIPDNLDRLKSRGVSVKRSLALREFALGIEGLHRFVERQPLRTVHECVFGVLALESEPVDPRL